MNVLSSPVFLLVTASALAYVVATVGIKMAAGGVTFGAVTIIVAGFALAAASEALLLRRSELAVAYLAVISLETLAVLALAAVIGEGLSRGQIAGAALVVSGIALVSLD